MATLEVELKGVIWDDVLHYNGPNTCCDEFISTSGNIIGKLKTNSPNLIEYDNFRD